MSKLTDKQKFFCREYLKDFNATQAAIRAGYSKETARSIGSENLSKPDIQHYIKSLSDNLNARTDNDIIRIINELQLIAFGSLRDIAEWNQDGLYLHDSKELDDEARIVSEIAENRTDKGVSLKVKLHDKMKALEMLARYHQMFTRDDEEDDEAEVPVVQLRYALREKNGST